MPGLAAALPDPRYVQRLVEWVWEHDRGADPLGTDGRRLDLPVSLGDRLRRAVWEEDARLPLSDRLEVAVRELFLDQLSAAHPRSADEELDRQLELALHRAMIEPARIGGLRRRYRGSPLEARFRALLARELGGGGGDAPEPDAALRTTGPSWPRWLPRRRSRSAWAVAMAATALLAVGFDFALGEAAPPRSARAEEEPSVASFGADTDAVPAGPSAADEVAVMPMSDYRAPEAPRGAVTDPGTGSAGGVTHVALQESTPMRFRSLSGGEFTMGSGAREWGRDPDEGPRHRVFVSPFEIATTEVTQGQWKRVMGDNPSRCESGCGEDLPVQNVSWAEALMFLDRLSEIEGLSPCYDGDREIRSCTGYRLPSEAEWEYAARAGSDTSFSFGSDAAELERHAWYANFADGATVRPVASKEPNGWGLYDMHGNVWEWVGDWYGPYDARPKVDPRGPTTGSHRVLRGGSFVYGSRYLRTANRNRGNALLRPGLRCVRSLAPAPPR